MSGIWRLIAIATLVALAPWPGSAAQPRQWVTLKDCRYVAGKFNDGDSFRVRCGAEEFNLRLYFVDTPEPDLRQPERTREQSQYFGVTLDATMRAGVKAADAVRAMLRTPFVVHTRWAIAAGRTLEPRYYALVEMGSERLAELLIRQGLARTKGVFVRLPTGETARAYRERLEGLEREALERRLGIWAATEGKDPATRTH